MIVLILLSFSLRLHRVLSEPWYSVAIDHVPQTASETCCQLLWTLYKHQRSKCTQETSKCLRSTRYYGTADCVIFRVWLFQTVWSSVCVRACDLQCVLMSDRVLFSVVFSHTVYFSVVVFSDRVIFIVCLIKTVWSIDTPISIDTGILYIYRSLHRLRIRQSFIVLPMHILPMREQTFESRLSPNREVTRVWKVFFNVSA